MKPIITDHAGTCPGCDRSNTTIFSCPVGGDCELCVTCQNAIHPVSADGVLNEDDYTSEDYGVPPWIRNYQDREGLPARWTE